MTQAAKTVANRLSLARKLYGTYVVQRETWQAAIDYAATMLAADLVTTDEEYREFLQIVGVVAP